eukprot:Opistho-2@31572
MYMTWAQSLSFPASHFGKRITPLRLVSIVVRHFASFANMLASTSASQPLQALIGDAVSLLQSAKATVSVRVSSLSLPGRVSHASDAPHHSRGHESVHAHSETSPLPNAHIPAHSHVTVASTPVERAHASPLLGHARGRSSDLLAGITGASCPSPSLSAPPTAASLFGSVPAHFLRPPQRLLFDAPSVQNNPFLASSGGAPLLSCASSALPFASFSRRGFATSSAAFAYSNRRAHTASSRGIQQARSVLASLEGISGVSRPTWGVHGGVQGMLSSLVPHRSISFLG